MIAKNILFSLGVKITKTTNRKQGFFPLLYFK